MHADDYDVLAGAIAAEHRDAVAHGPKRAVQQVEHIALTIADTFASAYRTFDPVKFMLAACDATTLGQLSAPIRRQVADRFGTSEPRRRASSYSDVPLDPREAREWTADSLIGGVIPRTTQAGNMAISALNYYGNIHTLGELAQKTDEELQAIPKIGPGAMRAIREVLGLWRACQHPGSGPDPASSQDDLPLTAAQSALSDFPVANPLTACSQPVTASPHQRAIQRSTSRRGARPGA